MHPISLIRTRVGRSRTTPITITTMIMTAIIGAVRNNVRVS